jgi:hypothetical protein
VVLEEVIEGITAGFTYKHNIDLTDTSKKARGRGPRSEADVDASVQASSECDAVEVIIDIEPGDWVFMTQPGAVRCIIMNTFGNAIKYTTHGSVKFRLELNDQNVVLTITDTGKGITPHFLNSRLFMPFAQENALAPGTGLGLSICKSIVTMLGGYIDIQSRVNSGTTVKVTLPLVRPNDGRGSTDGTPHDSRSSIFSAPDRTIPDIKKNAMKCHVALYQACEADQHLSTQERGSMLEKYISKWYGLQIVELQSGRANIVLLEEEDLKRFGEDYYTLLENIALIILCNDSSRRNHAISTAGLQLTRVRVLEYLPKPVGPHKLAKIMRACLKKLERPDIGNFAPAPGLLEAGAELGIAEQLNEMTLRTPEDKDHIVFKATEVLSASQTSRHAQDAISTPRGAEARTVDGDNAYPFPQVASSAHASRRPSQRGLQHQRTRTSEASDQPTPNPQGPTPTAQETIGMVDPRMLIVDDNAINLKLLHTFLPQEAQVLEDCLCREWRDSRRAVQGCTG